VSWHSSRTAVPNSSGGHLARAKDNGLSEAELKEVIIHLAFYAGWPRAMSASPLKEIFGA